MHAQLWLSLHPWAPAPALAPVPITAEVSVPPHSQIPRRCRAQNRSLCPLPSPGRALPPAAALNKPLSVSLITLGCSSGMAGAAGG